MRGLTNLAVLTACLMCIGFGFAVPNKGWGVAMITTGLITLGLTVWVIYRYHY